MMKPSLNPMQALLVVVASFVIASVINIYPMSLSASSLRPMALIMVLVFWLIYKPKYVGVGTAFIVGIICDLLLDTRLGQQGFAAVVMAFAIRFINQYIRDLNLSMTWLVAAGALVVFQIILWLVQYITQNIFFTGGISGLLVSIVTWPLVYLALVRFRR